MKNKYVVNSIGKDNLLSCANVLYCENPLNIYNYNCSAFYEPSYVIARAYQNGGF